jgi:hypothetical protein
MRRLTRCAIEPAESGVERKPHRTLALEEKDYDPGLEEGDDLPPWPSKYTVLIIVSFSATRCTYDKCLVISNTRESCEIGSTQFLLDKGCSIIAYRSSGPSAQES